MTEALSSNLDQCAEQYCWQHWTMWAAQRCSRLFSSTQNRLCVFTLVGKLKGAESWKKSFIDLLSISIKYYLKINHQDAFSFSISFLVLEIFIFSNGQTKANLGCHCRNEIYKTKNVSQKVGKIHLIFPRICFHTTLLCSCKAWINSAD